MPELDLNFGSVGKRPPEQPYLVAVKDAFVEENKNKDGQNIVLDLSLMQTDDPQWEGYDVRSWISLKEGALWSAQEALEAITGEEWQEDNMKLAVSDEEPVKKGSQKMVNRIPAFIGIQTWIVLEHTDFGGRPGVGVAKWLGDDPSSWQAAERVL